METPLPGLPIRRKHQNGILVNNFTVAARKWVTSSMPGFQGRAISRQLVDATAGITIKVIALVF
jgi:hypothetical protein